MSWQNENNQLTKTFSFENFAQALQFTNQIAEIAEKLGHHPTIILSWGKVVVQTTTHDAGNVVTTKDWQLAEAIDRLLEK